MRQPDDPAIGGARKSLPTRKVRKVKTSAKTSGSTRERASNQKGKAPETDPELLRMFGEK